MNPADEMAAKPDAAGFGGEPDQQLRTILENLGLVNPVEEREQVDRDDLRPGFASRLDLEASICVFVLRSSAAAMPTASASCRCWRSSGLTHRLRNAFDMLLQNWISSFRISRSLSSRVR